MARKRKNFLLHIFPCGFCSKPDPAGEDSPQISVFRVSSFNLRCLRWGLLGGRPRGNCCSVGWAVSPGGEDVLIRSCDSDLADQPCWR